VEQHPVTADVSGGDEEVARTIEAALAEIREADDGWLDLVGFWRLFGGGGQCRLSYEAVAGQWVGTVTDREGAEPHHAPAGCRFSTDRVKDLLRMARRYRRGAGQWAACYEEPA
jgi:hypothetical protein